MAPAVLACGTQQQPGEGPLGLFVEASHHPEVEEADPAIVEQQKVAGMGIGVEHACLEDLVEQDLGVDPGHLPRSETGGGDGHRIIEADPSQAFPDQQTASADIMEDGGHDRPRLGGQHGPQPFGVAGLHPVVNLRTKCPGELACQLVQVVGVVGVPGGDAGRRAW